ncbi:MAG: TetR family transcriptional regulator [Coriobacteriia bacterium]|nr:TetR family transcriptional regulator [Coriobacteriia bacterium]MBN2823440.1 TetR family transcriptional regulator [Coriobacteriia bacterium]
MCSASSTSRDDRSTKARIRDAAIQVIAEGGPGAASVRAVAAAAGVSAALVIHHFESMEGLRVACDEHIATVIRELKEAAAAAGARMDPIESLKQQQDGPPLVGYLANVLTDSSSSVDALVNELVRDAVEYSEQMVASGLMKPATDPYGRAVITVMWSLGNLVLGKHIHRLLGVDIAVTPDDPRAAAAYMDPTLEIMHDGLITDTAFDLMKDAFGGADATVEIGRSRADE